MLRCHRCGRVFPASHVRGGICLDDRARISTAGYQSPEQRRAGFYVYVNPDYKQP